MVEKKSLIALLGFTKFSWHLTCLEGIPIHFSSYYKFYGVWSKATRELHILIRSFWLQWNYSFSITFPYYARRPYMKGKVRKRQIKELSYTLHLTVFTECVLLFKACFAFYASWEECKNVFFLIWLSCQENRIAGFFYNCIAWR